MMAKQEEIWYQQSVIVNNINHNLYLNLLWNILFGLKIEETFIFIIIIIVVAWNGKIIK